LKIAKQHHCAHPFDGHQQATHRQEKTLVNQNFASRKYKEKEKKNRR
jgi:hypothetical protein